MTNISIADQHDVADIVGLLNLTYRSKDSFRGWTSEADLIKGIMRADEHTIFDLMQDEKCVFLKYSESNGKMIGCVQLKIDGKKLYLGMLSVVPEKQGAGIGKLFLEAAEKYALDNDCHSIYMQVLSDRPELTDWYLRHGYKFTGERKPFEVDEKFGVPVKPLNFFILEKKLMANEVQ